MRIGLPLQVVGKQFLPFERFGACRNGYTRNLESLTLFSGPACSTCEKLAASCLTVSPKSCKWVHDSINPRHAPLPRTVRFDCFLLYQSVSVT